MTKWQKAQSMTWTDTEKPAKMKRVKKQKPDFMEAIRSNPAYNGIDIDRELAKMDAWLATPKGRGRKKTHGFVVNWLNKVDVAVPQEKRPWED